MLDALCLLFPVGAGCSDFVQQTAVPHEIVGWPLRDTPQQVRVTGVVRVIKHRASIAGAPFDVLVVCDTACIRVYFPQRSVVRAGERVSVVGTYYAQRKVGSRTFRHDVEAIEVTGEDF